MAKFKWPERIVNVDSLPQVHLGKIDKKKLRAWIADTLTRGEINVPTATFTKESVQ